MSIVSSELIVQWQQAIAGGDAAAFDKLFRHFYLRLVRFSITIIKNKEASEEMVSDVFVKIWNKKEDILLIDKMEIFLFVAVKNQCYNYLRKHSHLHVTLDDDGDINLRSLYNPGEDLAWKELQSQLNIAIEQLPEQCKLVFKLIREDAFKYKEVAEILHISPRTVETQLFRAVKKLRQVFIRQIPDLRQEGDILLFILVFVHFFAA